MIDASDVRLEADGKQKALWHKATHVPTGVSVEGNFTSGKAILEALEKAMTAQRSAKP